MATLKDTIMITDTPWNRAVQVVVIYLEDQNVLNVQEPPRAGLA